MAGNQAVVEFLLKWSESGGQLPDKVKRDLDRMGQSTGQAVSITDRLGQAFTRLERRQPTMFIRQFSTTIDGLAQSALGATGPIGRLGASFISLGPGGIATTAAIAGLGLIGLAYKQSAKEANEYIDITEKAIDATRRLLGSRHLAAIEERATAGEQLRIAKERLAFEQHPVIEGFAATPSPAKIQEASAAVSALQLQFDLANAAVLRIEASMRDSLATKGVKHVNSLRDATREMADAMKVAVAEYDNEMRIIQESHARTALNTTIMRRGPITLRGGIPAPAQPLNRSGEPVVFAPDQAAAREDQTAAILSAVLGLAGSMRGGAGGTLSGLGGLASVAFKSTPILGQVLSFGGGLLSLFSSGQAKVSISRLEQEALEQMRQVQQVPQYLSQNIVTNDLRGAKNRLARLEQLDTVTRGVT